MDKGQGGYHWSINPKKAEETNQNLKKAWNKNVKLLKASTSNPNFIERLVNSSVSKNTYSVFTACKNLMSLIEHGRPWSCRIACCHGVYMSRLERTRVQLLSMKRAGSHMKHA